jgi:hypothetical protein
MRGLFPGTGRPAALPSTIPTALPPIAMPCKPVGSMTALLILVNPVGLDMLKATEYPAALFGPTLADDNRRRSTAKIM